MLNSRWVRATGYAVLVEAVDLLARPVFWLIHYKPRR